jgi:hypothetical protein
MEGENKMDAAPGGEGAGGPALERWKECLPEELAGEACLADIMDVASLAKGYVHAQRMVGREKIALPREDAPEEWEAVYNRLGRPEKPEGYELVLPNGVPEGMEAGPDWERHYREFAHGTGLTKKQAGAVWEFVHRIAGEGLRGAAEKQREWAEAGEKENRTLWGTEYGRKMKIARRAALEFGGEEAGRLAERNPSLARMFARVGERLGEDRLGGGESQNAMGPAEARKEITSIIGDLAHPYHVATHPGHAEAVARVAHLHRLAYPEETE